MKFEKYEHSTGEKTRPAIIEKDTNEFVCVCKDEAWRDIILAALLERFKNEV